MMRILERLAGPLRRGSNLLSPDAATCRAPLAERDKALLSPTHVWLRSLPRSVHPVQLCRHYPRVANQIAACWHDELVVMRFLHELLVDRRGGRLGFPTRIIDEIDMLAIYRSQWRARIRHGLRGGHEEAGGVEGSGRDR